MNNIYIVLLIIILFIINNQPCYSIIISPKGTNTQVRNNLRKKIVFKCYKKIIDYDEHIPEFKKNIIDKPVNLVYTEKNNRKFIYE